MQNAFSRRGCNSPTRAERQVRPDHALSTEPACQGGSAHDLLALQLGVEKIGGRFCSWAIACAKVSRRFPLQQGDLQTVLRIAGTKPQTRRRGPSAVRSGRSKAPRARRAVRQVDAEGR